MVSLRKSWQVKMRLFRVLSAIVQSKFCIYKLFFLQIMMLLYVMFQNYLQNYL